MSIRTMIAKSRQRCTHETPISERDATGDIVTTAWNVSEGGADTAVWIQPVGLGRAASELLAQYARRGIRVTHRAYFMRVFSFNEGDRIVMGTRVFGIRGGANPGELHRFFYMDLEEEL